MLGQSQSLAKVAQNAPIPGQNLSDKKSIGFLIKDEDRPDIENFITNFPRVVEEYIPVAIIGEGNFKCDHPYRSLELFRYI